MKLKGEDLAIDENADSLSLIESSIRIDTCQASEYAVRDIFGLEVTQDANGVIYAVHKEGAE
jgi:hypothetical protein